MSQKATGRVVACLFAATMAAGALTACQNATTQARVTTVPAQEADTSPTPAEIAVDAAMDDGFDGEFGVVVIDGSGTYEAGDLATTNAWSTIKVPIVLAAVDADADLADSDLVEATLRWSVMTRRGRCGRRWGARRKSAPQPSRMCSLRRVTRRRR